MSEINHPIVDKKKIIQSTLLALIFGAIIFVVAVLPAEYGIDPVGAGKLLGFSKLYVPSIKTTPKQDTLSVTKVRYPLIKMEKAGSGPHVPRPKEADNPPPKEQLATRQDHFQVIVPAGKGVEFKINMLKYGKVKYEWSTDQGVLYFDFHGEVKQENPPKNVFFESYTMAYAHNMVGTFLAPFEGKHGWYFKNKTNNDIKVSIRLKGEYKR